MQVEDMCAMDLYFYNNFLWIVHERFTVSVSSVLASGDEKKKWAAHFLTRVV